MRSVLAFKRSLSAGILDGDSGEISLGGSRLNPFMKEAENVTRRMGQSEAVTPAEEGGYRIVAADDAGPAEDANADADIGVGDIARSNKPAVPPSDSGSIRGLPWVRSVRSSLPLWRPPMTQASGAAGSARASTANDDRCCTSIARREALTVATVVPSDAISEK